MPLSRLENFLKNAEGNILYVNPSDFDATDSYENRGNSLTRPFRTIQRALIESARFSYRAGRNNDKIDSTTILVYPGTHYIDNRPGHSIQSAGATATFKRFINNSWQESGAELTEFNENTNFDIFDEENELYKYNSVHGGVILPRGTSIVGLDLRKTKVRPLYVPDPLNDSVAPTSIFRVTGTCYFTAFSFFDADPSRSAYTDSTAKKVNPRFSHHKLTCFEYADGVNNVLLGNEVTDLTDLAMYYFKVTYAYGDSGGRGLADYPATGSLEFEPSIDEFRIVGDLTANPLGITSIRSGDGVIPTQTITVVTNNNHGLFKDTPVLISGISTNVNSYNGSFVVKDVLTNTKFTYETTSTPTDVLPGTDKFNNSQIIVESDSTSSASPYVFSCSLRSVFGVNGLHADGSKATGFKSMLTAQFTGISLQKDDNAFILFDETTNIYNDNDTVSDDQKPLHTNSRAIYRPDWENFHMKCSNDSIIQCVSIFAIGFAKHFVAESGGDQSITNSNSNFGHISLEASGFQANSFDRDDVGYITHIIPPREPDRRTSNITWLPLDATKIVAAGQTSKLWLANFKSQDVPPPSELDSYKIGGRREDKLYLQTITGTAVSTFASPIFMQVPAGISTEGFKTYPVGRAAGINSISSNIITLQENHQLFNGEKIRIYSDTGEMPANLEANKIYFALTTGLNANQIKISTSVNDSESGNNITGISNGGGELNVLSTVADKVTGEAGHPIQFDSSEGQWYVNSSNSTFVNQVYTGITGLGTAITGEITGGTFIKREIDNRGLEERIYKMRYVVPKEFKNGRQPSEGFILQESKNVGVGSASFLDVSVTDPTQLRNPRIITTATYNGATERATIKTELAHNFSIGDQVTIKNVLSVNNSTGTATTAYNGTYEVYSIDDPRRFQVSVVTGDPGLFLNSVNDRTTQQQVEALPTVQRSRLRDSLYIYNSRQIKEHIPGADGQDGVYAITAICGSIQPEQNIGYGVSNKKFSQNIVDLYPQQDRDNYSSDPQPAISHARKSPLGKVLTNDRRFSITRESGDIFLENNNVAVPVSNASITGTGNTTISLTLSRDHGFNKVKTLTIQTAGSGYNNSAGVTTTIYAADTTPQSGVGEGLVVRANVSTGNTVGSVQIVEPGGAYGIGDTMTVSASPAGNPSTSALLRVDEIYNNIGDSLELSGFADPQMNGVFKIIDVPNATTVTIEHDYLNTSVYKTRNDNRLPLVTYAGKGLILDSLDYNPEVGVATVTVEDSHNFLPGNTFRIVNSGNPFFKRSKYQVLENIGLTTFSFSAGVSTDAQTMASGTTIQRYGLSSQGKPVGAGEENLGGRSTPMYVGVQTALASGISKTDISITVSDSQGFGLGDYITLGEEILRVKANPSGNSLQVSRGQFSTPAKAASSGQIVQKINILPMELRRHSILRASAHTFEYLGFGPGNYSTGMPQVQDRILTEDEVLLAQAREQDGGAVVYTGMNDRGEFFTGATKVNGTTGEETTFGAPVVNFFGDESKSEVISANNGIFDDLIVKNAITVEGGVNQNRTSQFYGPVAYTNKVTVSSEEGLETNVFFLKGEAAQPKEMTVGISTPTVGKSAGDISFKAQPSPGGYIGHVFSDGDWRRWGVISKFKDETFLTVDRIAIGASSADYPHNVTSDAFQVNGTTRIQNLYVGGAVTFAANQTFSGVSYETIEVRDEITFPVSYAGTDNYVIKTENANAIAQFSNVEITGAAFTFGSNTQVTVENSFESNYTGFSTFKGTVSMGQLEVVGLASAATGIFTSVETQFLQVGTYASIKAGYATDFYVEEDLSTKDLFANVGIITTLEGTSLTYDTITGTDVFATGLRATKLATPNARVNTGIVTTLIVPSATTVMPEGGTAAQAGWAGLSKAYVGVGIVTTLVIASSGYNEDPSGGGTNSSVDGWIGAPQAYINSGIVTTISGTTATYTVVNAQNVYSSYIAGQSGGDPAGAGLLYVANAEVGSKLWLSGTAAGEGLRANVGVITYFGTGAQNVLGNAPGGSMNIYAGDSGLVRASQFQSTIAQGAAPFTVVSTTKVTNLNADLLDDKTATAAATANTIMSRNGSANSAINKLTSTSVDNSGNIDTNTLESTGNLTVGGSLLANGGILGDSSFPTFDRFRMKRYVETYYNYGNVSGTVNLDLSQGNNFRVRLTGSTVINFTNTPDPSDAGGSVGDLFSFSLLIENGSNNISLTFGSNVNWPGGSTPSRSTGNNDIDIWVFQSYNGSSWYGNLSLIDMS